MVRTIYGMIAEVEDMLDTEPDTSSFRIVLVPHAHRLTMVETQEVFLDLSVPDIIKQKLELVRLGDQDVDMRLTGKYEAREMVVEYKESDLTFISRLTEHLGISFFFIHEDGHDTVAFTDHAAGFVDVPGHPSVVFRPRGEARDDPGDPLHHAHFAEALHPAGLQLPLAPRSGLRELRRRQRHGRWRGGVWCACQDACGEQGAGTDPRGGARSDTPVLPRGGHAGGLHGGVAVHAGGSPEVAGAVVPARRGRASLHAAGHPAQRRRASSKLQEHLPGHAGRSDVPPAAGDAQAADLGHRHGHRSSREPDGAVGKYADIDQEGRYTVRFTFDTAPSNKRLKSSRSIRMIQPHAGPNYGMHFPLHPGVEVAIIFVDGDPDRPLIQGAIPNPATSTPVQRQNLVESRVQTASGMQIVLKDA